MNDSTTVYGALTSYRILRSGRGVYVGDQPDVRICTYIEAGLVCNNWPSQGRPKFAQGYIRIQLGSLWRFDIARGTIAGKKRFLFLKGPETTAQFTRQVEVLAITEWFRTANPFEKYTAQRLLDDLAHPKGRIDLVPVGLRTTGASLLYLSLWQLRDFRAMLMAGTAPVQLSKAA
jgi:hypothetical protein